MSTQNPSPKAQKAQDKKAAKNAQERAQEKSEHDKTKKEIGGFKDAGLAEPTRFGDWEVKGRCSDF